MEMRKCINGHYYDVSIHATCPYCENKDGDGSKTVGLAPGMVTQSDGDSRTLPIGYQSMASQVESRTPVNTYSSPVVSADDDDNRTVALIHKEMGVDPVVGWLVCLNNSQKGRDYRIHSDNNYVGRSDRMDVCIKGDETISRENHAIVSYDGRDNIFYFSPGDGRSIVRVNDKAVFNTIELKAYDVITIGKTNLLFIPLCSEKFEWSAAE